MKYSTTLLIVILLIVTNARGESFSVIVPGIPRPVTMTFPDGFTPPDSTAARNRRDSFLEFYRKNPAMKGKYCEVLLLNWKSTARIPQIVVGVLGSTERQQGRISASDWSKIREMFLKASASEITKIREKIWPVVDAGSPVATKVSEELLWLDDQRDQNSVVILAQMRSQIGGEKDDVFSARKLIFHQGYLLFVNIVVDSSKPAALREIRSWLPAISIESI